MIAIIASGANLASVLYACERLQLPAQITHDASAIKQASHVILPGVGTARQSMAKLQQLNLVDVIRQLTQPVLGICLGMQLLYDYSAEGDVDCLGIIPGKIQELASSPTCTVPHMGWNRLQFLQQSPLLDGINLGSQVYFVHSYAAPVTSNTLASSKHGVAFSAICQQRNFLGMQFHPERSGKIGERLLKNFFCDITTKETI